MRDPHVAWLEALARVGVVITFEWTSAEWATYPHNFQIQLRDGPRVSVDFDPFGSVFSVHVWAADGSGRGRTFHVYAAVTDARVTAYARIREPHEIAYEIVVRAREIARELDSSGGRR